MRAPQLRETGKATGGICLRKSGKPLVVPGAFFCGPSQAILKQAPGAEIVDFPCAQGFRAARTEGAKPKEARFARRGREKSGEVSNTIDHRAAHRTGRGL